MIGYYGFGLGSIACFDYILPVYCHKDYYICPEHS